MIPGNVDQNKYSIERNQPRQTPPQEGGPQADAFSTFFAARNMSYEELTARRKMQQEMMRKEAEETAGLMTDAMRQANIDVLVSVANYGMTGMPGMTPDQAVLVLRESLARPDHAKIKPLYPGLEEAVEKRYASLKTNLLPERRKE